MGITKKQWHDYRCRKIAKYKKVNKVYKKCSNIPGVSNTTKNDYSSSKHFNIEFPKHFSVLRNGEETIGCFNKLIDEIYKKNLKETFYLDSKNVEQVTIDALAYLIAIVNNIKLNKSLQHMFSGNLPEHIGARKSYVESGFLNFFNSACKSFPKSNDKLQIKSGKKSDPETARAICEFVMEKLHKDKKDIIFIQKTLIELMSNTKLHAYNSDMKMEPVWYIFAEHRENKVRIIFLDTGLGIAKTVKRKNLEIFGTKNDAELIYAAFSEQFRSGTGLPNRGHGLHLIKSFVEEGKYRNFVVVSGQGQCEMRCENKGYKLINSEHREKLYGTVYIIDVE